MIQVTVPDVGTDEAMEVIEVLVAAGDAVAEEQSIVVLESDKATIEVPCSAAGTVAEVHVKTGDKVQEGVLLLTLEAAGGEEAAPAEAASDEPPAKTGTDKGQAVEEENDETVPAAGETGAVEQEVPVVVPGLGDIGEVEVIELPVAIGDTVDVDQVVAVLESDKATIEVPAEVAGTVQSLSVAVGDKLAEGAVLLVVSGVAAAQTPEQASQVPAAPVPAASQPGKKEEEQPPAPAGNAVVPTPVEESPAAGARVHAGPAVRKLAREMGVTLDKVSGTGPKQRILKEDVYAFVKQQMEAPEKTAGGGLSVDLPEIDFSKFGETEALALNNIRKASANNLHRSWLTVPHVTQFDEADITELEAFRKQQNAELGGEGVKLTMLAFLVSACARALQEFPQFNSSLLPSGETLVMKKYCNIGIAVDTPNGLVVPVIKDADKKGFVDIAREMSEISEKARNRKLTPADMQGGCFSISSLGGIGGTAFTPIVNWPEVAILGVSRMEMKPKYSGGEFVPRLMLPLSLSYDHRVIDGADAARFTTYLSTLLADMRKCLL